jgi:YHS domain-containing protein
VTDRFVKWRCRKQGKKYYFCAAGCKKAFDQNSEKYLAEGEN